MTIFIELSLIILIATGFAVLAKLLRQPLLVGYVAAGVLIGPYALNLLHSTEEVELFSKIGITILLFIVGLSLNPDIIREVGKTSFLAGLGQVLFTAIIGFLVAFGLGFGQIEALYIGVALTFSSTIIILKLLADNGGINKLYGKIALGILLVQDVVATLALVVVTVFGQTATLTEQVGWRIGGLLLWVLVVGLALYLISKYVLPHLAGFFAGNQEMLFMFSLSWGLGLAGLFQWVGLSVEVGALAAGITLAASPFAYEISSRLKPLRDFFLTLFFVLLGAQIAVANIAILFWPALVLALFVLVGNPIIVIILLGLLGYRSRTGFLTGITMAQVSEFSLVFVAVGLSFGHISQSVASLVTLVGIITIVVSSYLITDAEYLYRHFKKIIDWFSFGQTRPERRSKNQILEMVIFGYDRVGYDFVAAAKKLGAKYLVVDFNPQAIKKLQAENLPFKYGDAEDVEFLQEIGLTMAKLVVSTVPDFKTNLLLVNFYRQHNSRGIVIVLSHNVNQTRELYLAGASYVVMPHYLGAHHASELIKKHGFDMAEFTKERNKHLAKLAKREA